MRKAFLFIGFLAFAFISKAQPYTSRLGRFKVDQIRGCAPLTVNITSTSFPGNAGCTAGTPCIMNFDGTGSCPPNASCQNVIQFTYTTAGTYKLSVLYQSIGADDITITVDPNTPPPFDIFTCAGDKVEIKITDSFYDSYAIDFNDDGTIDTSIPSGNNQIAMFSYGSAGNYNISVKGKKLNAANNCNANVQPFKALTALPIPSISTLLAVDTVSLQLGFTPQTNIEYHANIAYNNASNFQQYQTLYAANSLTIPNLTLNKNYYCFELSSYDPCANTDTYSSPVCSHEFSLAKASGVDQLSWQTASMGISTIQITRNNTNLTSVAGTATNYNDAAIVCKTEYCYQLISKYPGGATSTSLQKCVTSFLIDTPTPINNTSAIVSSAQVDLAWLQDPAFVTTSYNVFRSQNGGAYVLQKAVPTKLYTDATYSEGYCYKISYTDNCDNASVQGLASCPIILNGSADDTNEVILHWSQYKGWAAGVKSYTIQKFNQQGQLLQTINAGTDTTYTDTQVDAVNQVVLYKITANANQAGVSVSISNEIKVVKGVNLFYPTAFNPDSKVAVVNRTFTVKGHYISKLELQVFDRWGSLVFFSDKNEPWDGRRDGINMPDATYVWTAQGTDLNGSSFKKAGTVILIRK